MLMKSTSLIRLVTLFVGLTLMSCERSNSDHVVSFNDSLKHAITQYVNENHIDLKSRVIVTDWITNPYRTDVYISNSAMI